MKIYFYVNGIEAAKRYIQALPNQALAAENVVPMFTIPPEPSWIKVGEIDIDSGMLSKAQVKAAAIVVRDAMLTQIQADADATKAAITTSSTTVSGL